MISTTRTSPQFPRKTRSKPFQLNKNSSSLFLHLEAVRFSWYAAFQSVPACTPPWNAACGRFFLSILFATQVLFCMHAPWIAACGRSLSFIIWSSLSPFLHILRLFSSEWAWAEWKPTIVYLPPTPLFYSFLGITNKTTTADPHFYHSRLPPLILKRRRVEIWSIKVRS